MSDSSNPIDRTPRVLPITPPGSPRRERPAVDEVAAPPVDAATFDGIPASPPDDVLAEIDAAMGRLEDLRDRGVSVTFDVGAGSGARIELVDDDGTRREIGGTELFDVVSGRRAGEVDPSPDPGPGPDDAPRVDREA